MKKVLSILFVCILLVGCGNTAEEVKPEVTSDNNVGNPMVEKESLEEVNEIIGSNMQKPGVMGISDEKYFVINNKIGQYDFSLNGVEYTLRAGKTYDDISGIYLSDGEAFDETDNAYATYISDEYKIGRFFYDGVQYSFVSTNSNEEYYDFDNKMQEILNQVASNTINEDINSLLGVYGDSVGQRATLRVYAYGPNEVSMEITWSNTNADYDKWNIIATLEDGKLNYNEITHYNITEDGYLACNDCIPGYFEVIDGAIAWTGSMIENTSSCIFVK